MSPITVTSAHEKNWKTASEKQVGLFWTKMMSISLMEKVFKRIILKEMSLYLVVERFNLFEKYAHSSKWESCPQGSG